MSDNEQPADSSEQPSGSTEQPSGSAEQPSGSSEQPSGSAEQPSTMDKANNKKGKKEKGPGFWSRYFAKYPKELIHWKRIKKVFLFWVFFCVLISFPTIRAIFYPVCELFGHAEMQIETISPVFTSQEPPTFVVTTTRCNRYEISVYKKSDFLPTSHIVDQGHVCNDFEVNPSVDECTFQSSGMFRQDAKPVFAESGFFIAKDVFAADKRIRLPLLPAGDYVASFSGYDDLRFDRCKNYIRSVRVSDLGMLTKQDDQQLMIYTLNLLTGKPQANIDGDLYWRGIQDDNHTITKLATVKTDSNGLYVFNRPKEMTNRQWGDLAVAARQGDNHAYVGAMLTSNFNSQRWQNHEQYPIKEDRYKVFLTGDRPIYKLGHTIQYRGVLRYLSDAGMKNLGSGETVSIDVIDPDGQSLSKSALKTDQFGAFTGSYQVAKTGKTGVYNVIVHSPDLQEHVFRFSVIQYRKPEYIISVVPEKKITFQGEKLKFKVNGSYYFGGGVPGADIKYTITSAPSYDAKASLFRENLIDEHLYYFNQSTNITGEAKTNDQGEAVVEIDTKSLQKNKPDSDQYDFGDVEYTCEVEMTDTTNHRTQSGAGSAVCAHSNLALGVGVSDRIVQAGQPVKVDISACAYDGTIPQGSKVTVELATRVRKSLFSAVEMNLPLASVEAVIGQDGKTTVSIPTKQDQSAGWYHIVLKGKDALGRIAGSTAMVNITSDNASLPKDVTAPLTVTLDKPSYKCNEKARVILSSASRKGESQDILLCVEGAKLHEYKLVHTNGPSTVVAIDIRDEYAPNAYITAAMLDKNHTPRLISETLLVDASFHYLDVKLLPLKKTYRAGDTAKCQIKVSYKDGKPAANAQLSFKMTDLSIYAVAEESNKESYYCYYGNGDEGVGDIKHSFYGAVENRVATKLSFEEPYSPNLESKPFADAAGVICFGMPFLWPMMITNRISEQECEFTSKKADLEAKMSTRSSQGAPAPTAHAASIENPQVRPKTTGYLNGGADPRVRKDFNDQAAWFPTVTTDAGGGAIVSIKLPDDLTTWKGECEVVDREANVGDQSTTIMTTQDFIARLGLPRFFTEGDRTIVEGTVHNYSEGSQSVDLSLAVTPQIKVLGALLKKVNVPKGGIATHRWPIEVVGEGEASITLKAVGPTAGDALSQKIPCRALGYRAFFAKAGVIKDEKGTRPFPINVPTDAKLRTGTFEMTLSSSQIGPVLGSFDKLIDYPYGCTEQTLSRLIPSVVAMRLHTELGVDLSEESKQKFQGVYDIAMPKLADYQHPDGGWGWWHDDASRAFLTAQVLEGFFWLEKAEYSVERDRVDRGLAYLEGAANGIFAKDWRDEDSVDHAKAHYVLSLYGKKMVLPQKAWQLAKLNSLNPEALAYLTMAFKNVGDEEAAQTVYRRLLELKNESNDYINWDHTKEMVARFHSRQNSWIYTYRFTGVETTALALRAVLAMEPKKEELIDPIVRWLIVERDENGWNNTKSTAQVFISLLERELATRGDRTTHFKARITSGEKLLSMLEFNKAVESGERNLKIGLNPLPAHIKLEKEGPGWLYYTSLLEYDRPLRPEEELIAKSKPDDLKITREFFQLQPYDKDKKPLSRQQAKTTPIAFYVREPVGGEPIHAGDVIQMKVSINSPINIPYVMVESALPSGAEVIKKYISVIDKAQLKPDYRWDDSASWWWDHQDVLDDRMGFFVGNMNSGKCYVEALIRMERPGEFGVNPVTLEAMYSKQVRAYSTVHRLKVIE